MPELIAKGPWGAQLAVTKAGVTLAPLGDGPTDRPIWSVALFPGGAKAVAKALKPLGLSFPAPGQVVTAKGGARLVWTGRDQAFLMGAPPPEDLAAHAAVTDQSDGWAGVSLTGAAAADTLARLVPLDLREAAFPPGHVARAAVGHMAAMILRTQAGFEVWVFRSMARTLWHELAEVLDRQEARSALKP